MKLNLTKTFLFFRNIILVGLLLFYLYLIVHSFFIKYFEGLTGNTTIYGNNTISGNVDVSGNNYSIVNNSVFENVDVSDNIGVSDNNFSLNDVVA